MNRYIRDYDDPQLDIPGVRRERGFLVRDGDVGRRTILLAQDRVNRTARFMRRTGDLSLEVNCALGHPIPKLDCLRQFTFLRGFSLIHGPIDDIQPIHQLVNLRKLSLQAYWEQQIDFTCFSALSYCRTRWWRGARSVFACMKLKSLFLDYFKSKDISPVARLRKLRELTITNSPLEDLTPLRHVGPLRRLRLINLSKLKTLSELIGQSSIEFLAIDGSRKLRDLSPLAEMKQIRTLYLGNAGELRSLEPLAGMTQLQELFMWEDTTIVDRDLSALFKLPALRKVAFANRRGYSHTCEEVEAHIRSRASGKRRRSRPRQPIRVERK